MPKEVDYVHNNNNNNNIMDPSGILSWFDINSISC